MTNANIEQMKINDACNYVLKSVFFLGSGTSSKFNIFFATMICEKMPAISIRVKFSNSRNNRKLYENFNANVHGKRVNLSASTIYILANKVRTVMENANILDKNTGGMI